MLPVSSRAPRTLWMKLCSLDWWELVAKMNEWQKKKVFWDMDENVNVCLPFERLLVDQTCTELNLIFLSLEIFWHVYMTKYLGRKRCKPGVILGFLKTEYGHVWVCARVHKVGFLLVFQLWIIGYWLCVNAVSPIPILLQCINKTRLCCF